MSLDLSTWWTAEDCQTHLGVSKGFWKQKLSPVLRGLGRPIPVKSEKNNRTYYKLVYDPKVVQMALNKVDRKRIDRQDKFMSWDGFDRKSLKELANIIDNFGFTPGYSGPAEG